jgi:hypothetical protein
MFGKSEWLFPSFARNGTVTHVVSPTEEGRPSPHRLRDTYATAAHEAEIPRLDQKILMNHKLPKGGDVTEGYQRPSWDHLVQQQERIAQFLVRKVGRPLASPESNCIFDWSP